MVYHCFLSMCIHLLQTQTFRNSVAFVLSDTWYENDGIGPAAPQEGTWPVAHAKAFQKVRPRYPTGTRWGPTAALRFHLLQYRTADVIITDC